MASFNTIELLERKGWPSNYLPYGGTCTGGLTYAGTSSPAAPTSEVVQYSPVSTVTTKSDPLKGTNRKWRQIQKSGEISFTPYSVSETKTQNFVVEVPYDTAAWRWNATACSGIVHNQFGPEEGHTRYLKRENISTLGPLPNLGAVWNVEEAAFNDEVREAISTTQQAAFAQAMSTFDLLTELAESRETLKYMQSLVGGAAEALRSFAHTDEPTYRRARSMSAAALLKHSDKAFRRLGSRWMEYRYAIMPLIYSFKDVNELLGQSDSVYKSGRDRSDIRRVLTDSDFTFPSEGRLVYKLGSMNAKVSSLVKSRYDRGALQRVISQVSFNPFNTAWNTIPLSFVVDWWLNVGDAITAATTIDLSSQTLGCTGIKRSIVYDIVLFDNTVDRSSQTFNAFANIPARTLKYEFKRSIRAPVQRVSVESYERIVFTRPKPQIHFDPYLTWKRYLDGLVLSYQPIKKLLRSL